MTRAAEHASRKAGAPGADVGIVLGTGLGGFADSVRDATAFGYGELEGFPAAGVGGHDGRLVLGAVGGTRVAVCQGRAHYYERGNAGAMAEVVRTLKALGCGRLILTNAAGSLMDEAGPGSVVMVTDHINLTGTSPLIGVDGDDRFVDMADAYSPALRARLHGIAEEKGITLHEGVYAWFAGPQFETPAEIRMAGARGAHVVGMSTVPEVILGRHAGMEVAALSVITNMAAGLSREELSHRHTVENAREGAERAGMLITALLESRPPAAPSGD